MKKNISVTILTKNSSETIKKTLLSVQGFDEIIVLDTGSSDDTLKICSLFPKVSIHKHNFIGFGPTHNLASSLAKNDWILSIDSDEIVTDNLFHELSSQELNDNEIYSIRRHNFFREKHMKSCSGWDPDWVIRLYNKSKTKFSDDMVHEKIISTHSIMKKLRHPLLHTPYRQISDFLQKMQSYSSLFASQNQHKKKSSLTSALLHSSMAFIKSYIFKKGFMQGAEGLIISMYNSHVTFYKYLKLAEYQKK